MKNEIPPSTTIAPMAMNRALLPLSPLEPDELVEAFWMAVGVALAVDGVGETGRPGDSALLPVEGAGMAGALLAVAAAVADCEELAASAAGAPGASATSASTPPRA